MPDVVRPPAPKPPPPRILSVISIFQKEKEATDSEQPGGLGHLTWWLTSPHSGQQTQRAHTSGGKNLSMNRAKPYFKTISLEHANIRLFCMHTVCFQRLHVLSNGFHLYLWLYLYSLIVTLSSTPLNVHIQLCNINILVKSRWFLLSSKDCLSFISVVWGFLGKALHDFLFK